MLKGTEKQIAWAEDIMNIARETVNSNIKAINTDCRVTRKGGCITWGYSL